MPSIIGAHVSAAGGIFNAPKRANEIGCNAVQIFTKSPRTWAPSSVDETQSLKFKDQSKKLGIVANVIHAVYLVNLASDKPELVEKSRNILIKDMEIAAQIGSVGVVVHLGSHQGRGFDAMKDQLAEEISQILDQTPQDSVFLIENSAGQKGKIASDLTEIRFLMDQVNSSRLGWCFDTCHGHAGGNQLATSDKIQDTRKQTELSHPELASNASNGAVDSGSTSALDQIESIGLLESLKVIHVNDSRDEFGSGRDRHENLGKGKIPTDDLIEFVNDPRIKNLPLILEVPGFDGKGPDEENVDILKSWMAK